MAKYFTISAGLRGCYMPDSSYTVRVETRRALKDCLASEAYDIRDAGFVGCSKKAIAWLANRAWKEAQKKQPAYLPFVSEYRRQDQKEYPYGLFCSVASRADYLAQDQD